MTDEIRSMSMSDLKHQELPLARIKKIMKLDDDVKVIYIASRSVNFSVDSANFDITNYLKFITVKRP